MNKQYTTPQIIVTEIDSNELLAATLQSVSNDLPWEDDEENQFAKRHTIDVWED